MPVKIEIAPLPPAAAWVSVPGVTGFYGGWTDGVVTAA
jgi:hypothetical protein